VHRVGTAISKATWQKSDQKIFDQTWEAACAKYAYPTWAKMCQDLGYSSEVTDKVMKKWQDLIKELTT
jgi:hypothetical protein